MQPAASPSRIVLADKSVSSFLKAGSCSMKSKSVELKLYRSRVSEMIFSSLQAYMWKILACFIVGLSFGDWGIGSLPPKIGRDL